METLSKMRRRGNRAVKKRIIIDDKPLKRRKESSIIEDGAAAGPVFREGHRYRRDRIDHPSATRARTEEAGAGRHGLVEVGRMVAEGAWLAVVHCAESGKTRAPQGNQVDWERPRTKACRD